MLKHGLVCLAVLCMVLGSSTDGVAAGEGFYFSLGLGGGIVSGDRDVALSVPKACPSSVTSERFLWSEKGSNYIKCVSSPSADSHAESVRTDFGSGMGFQLRIGYNIRGFVSLEGFLSGNGDPGPGESAGIGHTGFQLRYHPVNHSIPVEDRLWDADVMLGVGYAVGGFSPDPDIQLSDDEKAWDGMAITTGVAFNYQVAPRVDLGLDFKFVFPRFSSFIANWDKNYVEEPEEIPFTMIFLPTLQINFLF